VPNKYSLLHVLVRHFSSQMNSCVHVIV